MKTDLPLPRMAAAFTYTNHRGETSRRWIIPEALCYGATEWHPEAQWLVRAYDVNKGAERMFALRDFGHQAVQLDVEIEALKKELAQKDDTIRAFVATLRLTGNGRDPMATRSTIAHQLEREYFADGTP